MKEIKVDQRNYIETKIKCHKCNNQLLLLVYKDSKKKQVTLGCGHCGHKNEIEVRTDGINMCAIRP